MDQKLTFLKILARESVYMLLMTIVACGAALLQTVSKNNVGTHSSIIFSGYIYEYNVFMYILGIVLYCGIAVILYKVCMKDIFKIFFSISNALKAVVWGLLIIWGVVMFLAEMMVLFLYVLGLGNDLQPENLLFITVVGWPIITLLFLGVMNIRNKVSR